MSARAGGKEWPDLPSRGGRRRRKERDHCCKPLFHSATAVWNLSLKGVKP